MTSLALSYTSASLLVGTATGSIHIYDIASHQLLLSISTHKGLPITYIQAMLKPPDLIGHVSLTINVRSPVKDTTPPRPVVPFQRVRDAKVRESHEVLMVLPGHLNVCSFSTMVSFLLFDYLLFVIGLSRSNGIRRRGVSARLRQHDAGLVGRRQNVVNADIAVPSDRIGVRSVAIARTAQ